MLGQLSTNNPAARGTYTLLPPSALLHISHAFPPYTLVWFHLKKIGYFSQQILRLTLKADFPLPKEGIQDSPENSKQTLAKDRKKITRLKGIIDHGFQK